MRRTRKGKVVEQHDPRGIYSQVVNSPIADEDEVETTVADSVPIDPGPQMSTQLSVSRPPVEDEEYMPVSNSELVAAASAVAEDVPSSQVEWYYKQIKKALVGAKDRVDTEEVELGDDATAVETVEESRVRTRIRSMLHSLVSEQMISDRDKQEFEEYRTGEPSAVDYFGEDPMPPALDTSEGVGLEDLAAQMGY